ncbi:tRNA (N(6)-L-threonylcarbamoyladenosine(37)-C(2))-methylthiotransferase MtaB [uncultured Ezakiella sp.]|uniref:tRNA (N(6)-L-threonylcarbamoyladenosine(37)-C(2))- methylthiotransferase MtaB n=1 Tax=uncultured Ezakiella sp. TaxID=1637529 RepID=UPI0025F286F3|nr:tRNA (N(6)-L-threonylcarbamoyladenosine(37)-C(2))-methylthiotransferase MtaB [uncultured Ezakiella sp.]
MKVKIKTLGCKVNFVESMALSKALEALGYELVEDDICDVFILNSCSVTNESDKKSRQALGRNRRINPDNLSIIMGCYSQVSKDELLKNKNVNIVYGNIDKMKVVDIINDHAHKLGEKTNAVNDISKYRVYENLPIHSTGEKTRAFLKIQDGCDNFCTYCIIPYARGRVRSRDIESIKKETQYLKESGVKELVITGIEVASYGKDLDGYKLIDAIEAVAEVDKNMRIRLSSLEISVITEDFLERVSKIEHFCRHFHLSLQSGSNKILKLMNRKYTTDIFKEKVNMIRKYFPDAGITSDVIVGFPNETDDDFKTTIDYVKEIKLSRIHVFPYSIRKNTKAALMEQVDPQIKNNRAHLLRDVSEELEDEFLCSMVDKRERVLIEERSKGKFIGYTSNYIRAEIDVNENPELKINQVVDVELKNQGGNLRWIVCSAK